MPKVSIITPTKNRQHFLSMLWDCVHSQSLFQDTEWLIHDGSQQAAAFEWMKPPHVRYYHVPGEMTIGAKRNALCDVAQGEIIAHFDDDDYYSPEYIKNMLALLTDKNVDFVKLFGFFLYQPARDVFAYWDLLSDLPWHWVLGGNEEPRRQRNNRHMSGAWGYGFSYVYRRQVWQRSPFPEKPHIPGDQSGFGEDQVFADAVHRKAGKHDFAPDLNSFSPGSCIHVIHASKTSHNMSLAFPQQILEQEWLPTLFSDFDPQRCARTLLHGG
jgi:glycosyltransferase involved in cell wall biosynthesis